jgi:hypothetical protein
MLTGLLAVSLVVSLAVPAVGQSSAPSPSGAPEATPAGVDREEAVARVRATDPRFADLPDYEYLEKEATAAFSHAALLASSYVRVLPVLQSGLEDLRGAPAFRYPAGWLVETTVVADCLPREQVDAGPLLADPCAWRHTWFHHVGADGSVMALYDVGDPEPMPALEPTIWRPPTDV